MANSFLSHRLVILNYNATMKTVKMWVMLFADGIYRIGQTRKQVVAIGASAGCTSMRTLAQSKDRMEPTCTDQSAV